MQEPDLLMSLTSAVALAAFYVVTFGQDDSPDAIGEALATWYRAIGR
jgi:hypothetical protein